MARYWVFLNEKVAGPYDVEQLIRLRGFSRQTMVCVENGSAEPKQWISPAEIPELAHIFRSVDQWREPPTPSPSVPKPASKPTPARPIVRSAPTPAPAPAKSSSAWPWIITLVGLVALATGSWFAWQHRAQSKTQEQVTAQALVENAALPSSSLYRSLREYFNEKQIRPRWSFERTPAGLMNVTVSWYGANNAPFVLAFETNAAVQTVRGLNTAAIRLLTQGFARPVAPAEPIKPKTSDELFSDAMESRRSALESGDFEAVWNAFSPRKRSEMLAAGISKEGFIRLQSLTHGLESGIQQTVLKQRKIDDTHRLVLLRQTQAKRPDMFLKQEWVLDGKQWKLNSEESKAAEAPAAPASTVSESDSKASDSEPTPSQPSRQKVLSLPGISR